MKVPLKPYLFCGENRKNFLISLNHPKVKVPLKRYEADEVEAAVEIVSQSP